MRKFTLSLVLCMVALLAWSNPIDQSKAYQEAARFISAKGHPVQRNPQLAYAQKGTASSSNSLYYVFNVGNDKGFVVVAGDDAVAPILGYVDSGSYDSNKLPDNAKAMLDSYAEQIEALQQGYGVVATSTASHAAISPLMDCTWNQGAPYNYLCPTASGESSRAVTGCVATAMAQVMYYHKWPVEATEDIPGYEYTLNKKTNYVTGELGTVFDWDAMKPSYLGTEAADDPSALAVAKLMLYAGKSVWMAYSSSGSGASTYVIPSALTEYFDYDAGAQTIERSNYSSSQWDELIYNELADSRPVIFSAASVSSSGSAGHAFVCDGYDGDGLYHINWGWGGYSNGYFRLALLNPDGEGIGGNNGSGGYSLEQSATIGIQPNKGTVKQGYAMTAFSLSTTATTLSRAAVNARFFIPVTLESYNMGETATLDVAVGLFDKDGVLCHVHKICENTEFATGYGWVGDGVTVLLGGGYDGDTYYIKLVCRETGDTEWQLMKDADKHVIAITINGNTATLANMAAEPGLTINSVDVKGNLSAGSVQTVTVNLTNTGDTYTQKLYFMVNGKTESGIGVNIDPGVTADYSFTWTPSAEGTYTLLFSPDEENTLATKQVTITAPKAYTLSFEADVDWETNDQGVKVFYDNTLTGTIMVTNTSENDYYDNLLIYLWYDGNDGYMYSDGAQTVYAEVPAGQTVEIPFSFEQLSNGTSYGIRPEYRSEGEWCVGEFFGWYTCAEKPASGIQGVQVDGSEDKAQPVYNLRGVRMPQGASLPKGIYIQGGKKVVVK